MRGAGTLMSTSPIGKGDMRATGTTRAACATAATGAARAADATGAARAADATGAACMADATGAACATGATGAACMAGATGAARAASITGAACAADAPAAAGEVFDIKRFAVHDGPGIRCTAFLKGCPLACAWCHNPEGKRPGPEICRLPQACIGCGACARACPRSAIAMESGAPAISRGLCARCGGCAKACPAGAIAAKGSTMTARDLADEFAKDEVFFATSGGGVTLSGGDPLFQPAFTAEAIRLSKARGYHTAVETCLYAAPDVFAALLPLPDLWIVDLKIYDDDEHIRLTGQSNTLILRNYATLAASGRPMLTRIPVIPSCTDSEENLAALGRHIAATSPDRRVELMFYNPLAKSKYNGYDMDFALPEAAPYAPEQEARLKATVAATGAIPE